jgi:leucyl aminopeptidase
MSTSDAVQVSVSTSPAGLPADSILVITIFEDQDVRSIDAARQAGPFLEGALARGEAGAKPFDLTLFHATGSPSVLLIGGGKREELDPIRMFRLASAASRHLVKRGFTHLGYLQPDEVDAGRWAQAVAQGAIYGSYNHGLKKTEDSPPGTLLQVSLVSNADRASLEEGARIGKIVGESKGVARDLVNLPANDLTPQNFAARAGQIAREVGLECQVLDEDAMRALKMESFLGVSAGSYEPARLIVMRYGSPDSSTRLALVGKGLTFDSGGLSLKPADAMETMKGDMGGGAAVVAGMLATARLAPANISVTGYVGATENMPSGRSMRPGDVLTAMNGKTIEVLNTDAEGRLVLADVLAYACREGATHIVDFATLTGGAIVALGHAATLATGKPEAWVREVVEAAADGLERAWPMPIYEEYRRAMDSEIADLKNTGGRAGAALTASAFLSEFVDAVPWAHMDVAGTAFANKPSPYRPIGGTGEGVGTIASLVQRLAAGVRR